MSRNPGNHRFVLKASNPLLVLTAHVPLRVWFGLGLVSACVFPKKYALVLGLLCLGPPIYTTVKKFFKKDDNWLKVNKGRMTAKIEGDFVVFLIGARNNAPLPTQTFKETGDAMMAMQHELEDNPDLGCLGIENYVCTDAGRASVMSVQYWRSAEHLRAYAASSSNEHFRPWAKLMRYGKTHDDFGFWHETFLVRDGEYEAIHVNCPPFGLLDCRTVVVDKASGKSTTMSGRLGKGDGTVEQDWPEGFTKNDTLY
ncbi:hypothetical protein EDD86DRAFT_211051 [Gorgonomyces haynaldii]|nr:hypothetical protein EDD86DRAFT_211051 [Gorgonomyces haynaldii]